MFTGIVEELGEVAALEALTDAARLTIRARSAGDDVALGDSISVNGVCLTVTGWDIDNGARRLHFDVMAESLQRSSLGGLHSGDPVNLERAVTASTRLGGHVVQGHVDAVGTVVARHSAEHWDVVKISAPPAVTRYLVEKGSVTVDGVSLTVTEADGEGFAVSLIPETLRRTTLGERKVGAQVNLEVDVIAKYVESAVARLLPGSATVTP
ncbi:MAG TPA: riboflavin synthase [Frankiaceae bacterium]|jgi:riboflavin synthase|nr:riboflavin synthase [Frankiaceae bacterium]